MIRLIQELFGQTLRLKDLRFDDVTVSDQSRCSNTNTYFRCNLRIPSGQTSLLLLNRLTAPEGLSLKVDWDLANADAPHGTISIRLSLDGSAGRNCLVQTSKSGDYSNDCAVSLRARWDRDADAVIISPGSSLTGPKTPPLVANVVASSEKDLAHIFRVYQPHEIFQSMTLVNALPDRDPGTGGFLNYLTLTIDVTTSDESLSPTSIEVKLTPQDTTNVIQFPMLGAATIKIKGRAYYQTALHKIEGDGQIGTVYIDQSFIKDDAK